MLAYNRCGEPASQDFGKSGRGWYEAFHCPSCGQAYEADGGPPTSEDFWNALLAQEDEWTLEAIASPSIASLKAVRDESSLSRFVRRRN